MADDDFKKAYDEHSQTVYSYLKRLLFSEDKAAEFLQEVFMRFLVISREKKIQNERSYLLRSARNLYIDFLRKKSKTEQIPVENFEKYYQSKDFTEEVDFQDLRINILKKLREAKPDYCEVFLLRVDHNLRYNEISEMLNIPERTLRRYFEDIKKILVQNFKADLEL